jgi:hypothetical protein
MSNKTQTKMEADWWISRCASRHRDSAACNESMGLFRRTGNMPDNISVKSGEISLEVFRMSSQPTVEVAGCVTVDSSPHLRPEYLCQGRIVYRPGPEEVACAKFSTPQCCLVFNLKSGEIWRRTCRLFSSRLLFGSSGN